MTVTEIAEKANVSIGTVDRVLHNRGRVSADTEAKIKKIIDESGYHTNPIARHLKKNGSYKVGLLIPKMAYESGYWAQIYEGVEKGVAEYSAFNFSLEVFEFMRPDKKSLVTEFGKLTKSNCNAWIIAPVMQEVIAKLLDDCEEKQPYCFIDSPLPENNSFSEVYQDPYKAGLLAGRLTALTAKTYDASASNVEEKVTNKFEKKTFAILLPYTEAYNLNKRAEGFCAWFANENEGEAVKAVSENSLEESVKKEVDTLLKENENVRGICTANAVAHVVASYVEEIAAKAMKEKRVFCRPAVTGFDLVPENCEALKKGTIDCLISQNPVEQGRIAVREIYKKLVLEEETDAVVNMPLEIYFKENLI